MGHYVLVSRGTIAQSKKNYSEVFEGKVKGYSAFDSKLNETRSRRTGESENDCSDLQKCIFYLLQKYNEKNLLINIILKNK